VLIPIEARIRVRRPSEDVADYFAAVSWLRTAWTTLPVPPAKLHTRDIDGQLGQRFSAPFAKVLSGLGGWRSVTVQDVCNHPTVARDKYGTIIGSPFDCGDCQGTGLHLVQRDVHDHPMYVALSGLSKVVRPSDGTPAPIEFVMALAWSGWDLDRAARLVGVPIVSVDHRETVRAMFLMSIRRLHGRYSSGPVGKSQAQSNAEDAA
jgi:hypothetical protein